MHGTGIVLIDYIGFDLKTLSFNEKFRPKDLWYNVVNPMNSASVELWVLTFCFVEMEQIVPEARDIVAPVWLFISLWMAK
jgi:hypothetical protein